MKTRDILNNPVWLLLATICMPGINSPLFCAEMSEIEKRVLSYDLNGDGEITIEEFKSTSDRFNKLDKNKDGVISSNELVARFRPESRNSSNTANQKIVYTSSVDGVRCSGTIWTPEGVESNQKKIPLVIFLGGGSGSGVISEKVLAEAKKRGWITMGLAGRDWKVGEIGDCTYTFSMAYLDHPNPAIGPCQQDILDGLDWAISKYPVDEDRVYLCGFSLGGRGTYMMGLKVPDRFAAIAPLSPASDMFELDIRTPKTRTSYPCRMEISEGIVGTSKRSATFRAIQSGRFLIENAYNLPVFHGHGTQDGLAYNIVEGEKSTFLHGYNMTIDNSWDDDYHFNGKTFKFGHTPTLSELHQRHEDGYDFAYMFTEFGHGIDTKWLNGAESNQGVGLPDPNDADRLLGVFDFFEKHIKAVSPESVVYKSYTDDLRKAYWVEIDVAYPWQFRPGAVRATRSIPGNKLRLEVIKLKNITIDVDGARLSLGKGSPLNVEVRILDEPVYDPALRPAPNELIDLVVKLKNHGIRNFNTTNIKVSSPLSENYKVETSEGEIAIGPIKCRLGDVLNFSVHDENIHNNE